MGVFPSHTPADPIFLPSPHRTPPSLPLYQQETPHLPHTDDLLHSRFQNREAKPCSPTMTKGQRLSRVATDTDSRTDQRLQLFQGTGPFWTLTLQPNGAPRRPHTIGLAQQNVPIGSPHQGGPEAWRAGPRAEPEPAPGPARSPPVDGCSRSPFP